VPPELAAAAREVGLDLTAALAIDAADAPLPTFGRARALGVILGNTRALWPRFLAALAASPALASDPDPLDRYTERVVAAIAPPGAALFFAHQRSDAGWLPIQALAERAGLATLAPSGLSIHPTFGPWIALRALIVLDADAPATAPPRPIKPCECARGCGPAREALARAGDPFDSRSDTWRAWAAVRLACPAGAAHRYPDDQLRYHYTRDLSLLADVVRRHR
jgi:methylmalonic aciduria homocystinuria type C protein